MNDWKGIDIRSKISVTNKLLKMYYFELDTTPNSESNYRSVLEKRIDKLIKSRDMLINGMTYKHTI
jgi:hypothetical protein